MAQINLTHVSKTYPGNFQAVQDLCLTVHNNEFLVLVGPSGCGKSTTLRMIAGLEEVSSGTIQIDQRIVNDLPAKDRDIAMVFQNYALYPHMSVAENMSFGLRLRKYPIGEIRRRVQEAAETLNIQHLLERRPGQLSGGECQRVAVGRAIVRKPKVFLFDEPLSNLDAKMRVQMRAEIHKLRSRLKTTFIYVTHDQTEAMTLGDRIAVMRDGIVQQCADPMTIYDHPQNKFVAEFIGFPPMNFITGIIRRRHDHMLFDEGRVQVKILERMRPFLASYVDRDILLGVRAEDIYDKLFIAASSPDNTFSATCEVVEPLGSEVYLYLNTGRHSLIARVGAHNRPEINREMSLVFDMNKVHFFDPVTEKTII